MASDADLKRIADSRQARIRNLLKSWRDTLSAEGRAYDKLAVSVYATWGGECVLRAIAEGPHADKTALKGGTLFRLWDGQLARPTVDLDLQAIDPATPGTELRDWLLGALCSDAFAEATGLVCRRENLEVGVIKDGVLPEAWRIEGDVTLGPPITESTSVRLCVEATWGRAPAEAIERIEAAPLVPKDASFRLLAARPEWMAAEKLHSLVSRGADNSRLKDFYDLAVQLLPRPGFSPEVLSLCLRHVFDVEFKGKHAWPDTADRAVGLTAGFADRERAAFWATRRWPELVGRTWTSADPTLGEACESIALRLERMGLLSPCPTAEAAVAFRALSDGGDRAACAALGALIRLSPAAGPRLRDRVAAMAAADGRPRPDAGAVLDDRLATLRRADGFDEVESAAAALGLPLDAAVGRIAAALRPEGAPGLPCTAPSAEPAAERQPVPADRLERAVGNLACGNLNGWLTGLSTLAEAMAAGQDVSGFEVPAPPLDRAKAAKAWASVARRNGFEPDLDAVLSAVRGAAAPAMR
jgi:hypothetical protein